MSVWQRPASGAAERPARLAAGRGARSIGRHSRRPPGGWATPRRTQALPAEASRLRVLWLLGVALILATAIWGRLAYWQVVEHDRLSAMADEYHGARISLRAVRGAIYDRNRQPLALNTTTYDVAVAPDQVEERDRQRVADELARVLGMPPQQIMDRLRSKKFYEVVRNRVPKEQADQLQQLKLPGVRLQPQPQRTYLEGGTSGVTMGSSLLGFVNHEGRGVNGVEQYYDRQLRGRDGHVVTYRDLYGTELVVGDRRRQEPVDGADLVLTIDRNVQNAVEQAVEEAVAKNKAERASIIVLEPKSGAVVAWASSPAYDANRFGQTEPSRMRDPIAAHLYEPGSVMKVVTLAAALDQGGITPDTTIQDPGYVRVQDRTLRDWDGANHGTVTMRTVLERSLNVGAVKTEQALGRDAFLRYLEAFGMLGPSAVDVAGESSWPARQPGQWRDVELATASYGQGISVNMVQMAAAINVVANGGRYVRPHVVRQVGGTPVNHPPARQVVKPETAAAMTDMMRSVVQRGSGHMARVPGFENDQAGKTGTSQISENGRYSDDHFWASYVGFLPAADPRFTMLVVVEKPNNGSNDSNEGYSVAAPVWKEVAEQIILQWRITPGLPPPSN